jgi:lysozyme
MAEEMLDKDLLEFEEYVDKLVEVPLDQSQYDALVAWTYNLGPTNLKSSTMLKVLNDNNYDEVPAQMRRWNKSNGEVLTGLVRRREAESLLFQGKEWHEV